MSLQQNCCRSRTLIDLVWIYFLLSVALDKLPNLVWFQFPICKLGLKTLVPTYCNPFLLLLDEMMCVKCLGPCLSYSKFSINDNHYYYVRSTFCIPTIKWLIFYYNVIYFSFGVKIFNQYLFIIYFNSVCMNVHC